MTVSPETHPDRQPHMTESEVAQGPEQESDQSRSAKMLVIIALVIVGLLAIPILVIAFSAGFQGIFGEDMVESEEAQPPAIEEVEPRE
jgi:flagellar basal body-associated protein FliL